MMVGNVLAMLVGPQLRRTNLDFSRQQRHGSGAEGKGVRGRQYPVNEYQRRKQQLRRRSTPAPKQSWPSRIGGAVIVAGIIGVPVGYEFGPPLVGCNVKGNISRNTGELIYHVPGQEHYWETRINLLDGERWFCSEEAARAAGWRKAFR
jgi:hypothetical protein